MKDEKILKSELERCEEVVLFFFRYVYKVYMCTLSFPLLLFFSVTFPLFIFV